MLVFRLDIVISKVVFFIVIEIHDFTNVIPLLLFLKEIGGINASSLSLLFLFLRVFLLLTLKLFLFIFSIVFFRQFDYIII